MNQSLEKPPDSKKDCADLWLELYKDNVAQGRHHDTLRSNITTTLITLTGAMLTFAGLDLGGKEGNRFTKEDEVIGYFIVAIGIYGMIVTLKHYEKFKFHADCAGYYRKALEKAIPNGAVKCTDALSVRDRVKKDIRSGHWGGLEKGSSQGSQQTQATSDNGKNSNLLARFWKRLNEGYLVRRIIHPVPLYFLWIALFGFIVWLGLHVIDLSKGVGDISRQVDTRRLGLTEVMSNHGQDGPQTQ